MRFSSIITVLFALSFVECNKSVEPFDSPLPQLPQLDYVKYLHVGASVEWDVDMQERQDVPGGYNFYFVGTERWFIQSVDSSSGVYKYSVVRSSSGTKLSFTPNPNTPQIIQGRLETFEVQVDASGLIYLPINSNLGSSDFTVVKVYIQRYHRIDPVDSIIAYPSPIVPQVDTTQAILRLDRGFVSFYHFHSIGPGYSRRYVFRLKGELAPSPSWDYFPSLSVGDTSVWNFSQEYKPSGLSGTILNGVSRWKVIAVNNTASSRIATIQRIFTGSWQTYGGPVGSGSVQADTSTMTVTEDSTNNISFNFVGQGQSLQYYGYSTTVRRFNPSIYGEVITIDTSVPTNYVISQFRKDIGLISYQMSRKGMIGPSCSYSLKPP